MAALAELLLEYGERRRREERRLRQCRAELMRRPEYARIEEEIGELNRSRGRVALAGGDPAPLAERVARLREEQGALLEGWGLGRDYLEPRYGCPRCGDTGYVGAELCPCLRGRLSSEGFAYLETPEWQESFAAFDEGLFPETPLPGTGRTQREQMRKIRNLCQTYARKFPDNEKPNLLFTGKTGLGKTYLLRCVVGSVRERLDCRIAALTAYELVNRLMAQLRNGAMDIGPLVDCDLLAIDDLGSEAMIPNVTIPQLFMLLNERNQRGKATLIATNLTPAQIGERYDERIASRLRDQALTMILPFEGTDVRLLR